MFSEPMLPAEVDSWARGSRATRRLALAGARRLPGASGRQGERASDGGERATHAGGVPIGREARTGVVLVWCEGLHSTYTPCVFRPGSRAPTSPGGARMALNVWPPHIAHVGQKRHFRRGETVQCSCLPGLSGLLTFPTCCCAHRNLLKQRPDAFAPHAKSNQWAFTSTRGGPKVGQSDKKR